MKSIMKLKKNMKNILISHEQASRNIKKFYNILPYLIKKKK